MAPQSLSLGKINNDEVYRRNGEVPRLGEHGMEVELDVKYYEDYKLAGGVPPQGRSLARFDSRLDLCQHTYLRHTWCVRLFNKILRKWKWQ